MHDLKFIRQHPESFDTGMARRGVAPQSAEILKLDEQRRQRITDLQLLQQKRNEVAKQIGQKKKAGENADDVIAEAENIKKQISELESLSQDGDELDDLLAGLPNLPMDDIPDGKDESANQEFRQWGEKPSMDFKPKDHTDIGDALGVLDFETAAKLSGSRFVVLRKGLARMERALAAFMLDIHTQQFGYQEVVPPFLVRNDALYGTGQLPKFAEDLFRTTTGHWLIPTAEVPLANLVREQILKAGDLPLRFTAYTPCFRSEAGAAGKDTRGMIRQHQFTKVELVSIVHPEKSLEEHEHMLTAAEEILRRLNLHYRVMLLCAGDMGFSARKTYDIEVWMPGQNNYREISSVSNCGDFQARRMKARFREEGEKETQFLHTLNGSGLAVGRTMIAILENYQNTDGSVTIPEALRPYMGGAETL